MTCQLDGAWNAEDGAWNAEDVGGPYVENFEFCTKSQNSLLYNTMARVMNIISKVNPIQQKIYKGG